MNDSSSRRLIFIITIALGLLMLLSAIPWSNLTGNTLKDFNLLSDLFSNERPVLSTQPVLTSEIEEVLNEEIPEVTELSPLKITPEASCCPISAMLFLKPRYVLYEWP